MLSRCLFRESKKCRVPSSILFVLGRFVCAPRMELGVHRKNIPRHKVPGTKRPKIQNVQGTKRPTLITKFSKTKVVLENWPHMLGNRPHPCTQFMVGVFLVLGG